MLFFVKGTIWNICSRVTQKALGQQEKYAIVIDNISRVHVELIVSIYPTIIELCPANAGL